jgi:hypothetical protein
LNEKEQKAKNKACGPNHVFVKELGCIKRERAEQLKAKEKAEKAKQQTPAPPPQKKGGSYCGQPMAPTMEELSKQTCQSNHAGAWQNCEILTAGPNGQIRCCCNWLGD